MLTLIAVMNAPFAAEYCAVWNCTPFAVLILVYEITSFYVKAEVVAFFVVVV